MEAFCNGSPVWNTTLTWSGSWPEFTQCFQLTVLVWGPCGLLWLASLAYLPYLLSLPTCTQPLSAKYTTKLLGCGLIAVLSIVDVAQSVSLRPTGAVVSEYFQADLLAPVVYMATMVLVVILVSHERKKDFIVSPVLFTFWLILLIVNIIPFYSRIILREYENDIVDFSLFYLFFLVLLVKVIVHCLTEEPAGLVIRDERPCKEILASVPSRMTFQWATGTVLRGYRKPLTEKDVDNLHPRDQSASVVSVFMHHWNKQIRPINHSSEQERRTQNTHHIQNSSTDETTPLLSTSVEIKTGGSSQSSKPSLFLALWRTFGSDLLLSHLWKLLDDALMLSSPQILGLLVSFVQDKTAPVWHGYLFALALFLSTFLQSIFFHQLLHRSFSISMRVKAALLSAIYRKSLKISHEARKESTTGETVNLMSVDACHIEDVISWLWALWSSPLNCCLSLYLLYSILGASMFAGLGFLLVLLPLNAVILAILGKLQDALMTHKDKRMKIINEVLNGIKILKLYAWEPSFQGKVSGKRDDELRVLWRLSILSSVMTFSWTAAPFLISLLTFLAYVLVDSQHWLSPEKAFVAVSYINILRFAINMLPMILTDSIKAVISLRRINKYLNRDDLDEDGVDRFSHNDDAISLDSGTFKWGHENDPTLHNITLQVPRGNLVAVVGMVGAGKSSLLSAMLGEMEKTQGEVSLQGSVAYVPQQAWIQNASLRDNVLFGRSLEDDRFKEVIQACALTPDLAVLPAGEETEIGEKGINLSGGQKQRVSLARAVYSDADVYLMDDPLSAVDSHVGKHIFNSVMGSAGLLKDKTRVLVTHGVHWLPMVDKIFVLDGGRIREAGSYTELISHDGAFAKFLATYFAQGAEEDQDEDEEVVEMKKQVRSRLVSVISDESDVFEDECDKRKTERQVSTASRVSEPGDKDSRPSNKATLIEEEKVETGNVSIGVFVAYVRAMGVCGFAVAVAAYCLFQAGAVATNVWLSSWTDDLDLANFTIFPANSSERRERNDHYLWGYGGLGLVQVVMIILYTVVARLCSVKASRVLHTKMLASMMRAPMSFFDTTPAGRIVNRFSMDMDIIDTSLPLTLEIFLDCASMTLATLFVISYSTPIFLSIILPLGVLYFFVQRFYVATSRQLQRLEAKSRSPIYNHFGETLAGVSVIRAYQEQERFILESEQRVDLNQGFSSSNYASNRWLGFRLEQMGNVIVFLAAVLTVASRDSISGGIVGLSISYALEISGNLNFMVRMACDLETQIVAVERVKDYSELESEDEWDKGRELMPQEWPQQGHIQFSEYGTRYREGLDLVLKSISCDIKPGEKVGIVGRTGAGKSSLTLSLFRLIEPASGEINIDGLDITSLGLHQLRAHLTILPQDPVLFAGTLRMNLDPFDQYTDTEVWTALEHAHLKTFVSDLAARLDHECGEGGENLSVGQKQLLCLARTLLRKTKILVFDEATAAVDLETDDLIQQTIRSEFRDCTVLTIAHRLNTVMDYDRILVLENGQVAEFDSPGSLLERTDGIFYQMAKDARLV